MSTWILQGALEPSLDVTTRSIYNYFTVLFERCADEVSMSAHSAHSISMLEMPAH